eukprot:2137553-Pleurochrysis_carterae.AAC.1
MIHLKEGHARAVHTTRKRQFLATALRDPDPNDVVAALRSAGVEQYLYHLVSIQGFQVVVEASVREVFDRIQQHRNARHSLHVMTDLNNLSREQFDVHRHLLFFTYHPPFMDDSEEKGDYYERLKIWETP